MRRCTIFNIFFSILLSHRWGIICGKIRHFRFCNSGCGLHFTQIDRGGTFALVAAHKGPYVPFAFGFCPCHPQRGAPCTAKHRLRQHSALGLGAIGEDHHLVHSAPTPPSRISLKCDFQPVILAAENATIAHWREASSRKLQRRIIHHELPLALAESFAVGLNKEVASCEPLLVGHRFHSQRSSPFQMRCQQHLLAEKRPMELLRLGAGIMCRRGQRPHAPLVATPIAHRRTQPSCKAPDVSIRLFCHIA